VLTNIVIKYYTNVFLLSTHTLPHFEQ